MKKIFKNPYFNSIYAEIYIIVVVAIMHFIAKPNTPDTFFDPIVALSMLVLSAAIMGFLFLGEPLQLYLDGKKNQSVAFFLRTVISFAAITAVLLVIITSTQR